MSKTNERQLKDVSYPATNKLGFKEVFDEKNHPRINILRDHFIKEGRLDETVALKIINDATLR